MGETKEVKRRRTAPKKKTAKKQEKTSIGDIVFGTVLIVLMLFTVLLAYGYYIAG